jgi:hypothetical protein
MNQVGKEENESSTKQFTKVRTTNHWKKKSRD